MLPYAYLRVYHEFMYRELDNTFVKNVTRIELIKSMTEDLASVPRSERRAAAAVGATVNTIVDLELIKHSLSVPLPVNCQLIDYVLIDQL